MSRSAGAYSVDYYMQKDLHYDCGYYLENEQSYVENLSAHYYTC
jgi:hypothetical protein